MLPGFEGIPLYSVARFFVNGLLKGAINEKAAAVSFNSFLAIFPGIIFLFTLISYVPIEYFQDFVMITLMNIMPRKTFDATLLTIEDIVSRQRGGLLSFGFIAALYFSTRGIDALIQAFNKFLHAEDARKWAARRVISLTLVFIQAGLLLFAISLIIVTQIGLNYLVAHDILQSPWLVRMLFLSNWIIILALYYFGISFIYYLAPARKTGFRFLSPGSILATILSVFTFWGFNFFIVNLSHHNLIYGSIGTVMLIMLWIYVNTLVLIIGFELNASIYTAKRNSASIPLFDKSSP